MSDPVANGSRQVDPALPAAHQIPAPLLGYGDDSSGGCAGLAAEGVSVQIDRPVRAREELVPVRCKWVEAVSLDGLLTSLGYAVHHPTVPVGASGRRPAFRPDRYARYPPR